MSKLKRGNPWALVRGVVLLAGCSTTARRSAQLTPVRGGTLAGSRLPAPANGSESGVPDAPSVTNPTDDLRREIALPTAVAKPLLNIPATARVSNGRVPLDAGSQTNRFGSAQRFFSAANFTCERRGTGGADRGVCRARFMGVSSGQKRPAVLLEGGYLSSPYEARLIANPEYRQKLAEAVAKALELVTASSQETGANSADAHA